MFVLFLRRAAWLAAALSALSHCSQHRAIEQSVGQAQPEPAAMGNTGGSPTTTPAPTGSDAGDVVEPTPPADPTQPDAGSITPPGGAPSNPEPAACTAGEHLCNATCVSDFATASCGSSCLPCPEPENGAATCDGVSCGVACSTDYLACGADCIAEGACCELAECCIDADCEPGVNRTASCAGDGRCVFECESGFQDCDGAASLGCEVDIQSDPLHCGACGTPCSGSCQDAICRHVGEPCLNANDCAYLGEEAECFAVSPGGANQPDGYCSLPCDEVACPADSACVYDLRVSDEPYCATLCDDALPCRAGYGCFALNAGEPPTCRTRATGYPCAGDADCQTLGVEYYCRLNRSDTPQALPAGFCTRDCENPGDCGNENQCLSELGDESSTPFCLPDCDPDAEVPQCRPDYTCLEAAGVCYVPQDPSLLP